MRLKTYTAATMTEAMDQVRREMGADAIIVATSEDSTSIQRSVRITAAVNDLTDVATDPPEVKPCETRLDETDGSGGVQNIRRSLTFHGLSEDLIDRLVGTAMGYGHDRAVMALGGALDEAFTFRPIAKRWPSRPLMLVGPPGVGKTVACAKLLTRAHRGGQSIAATTTDVRRAGGIEQLEAFTRILGIDLQTASMPIDLATIALTDRETLHVIDTAGTNPFCKDEMAALGDLISVSGAEPVLVLSAGSDRAEAEEIAARFAILGSRRLLCTRLDTSRRLGSLLAAAASGHLAFTEVSINAEIADGLVAVNPLSLARLLLRPPQQETGPFPPYEAA